jgi:hypothetical protein
VHLLFYAILYYSGLTHGFIIILELASPHEYETADSIKIIIPLFRNLHKTFDEYLVIV